MFLHCCYHFPLFPPLLPFAWLVILFCTAFVFVLIPFRLFSLTSLSLFLYSVLAFFLPVMFRYVFIAIVSISLLSLRFLLFFLPMIN